MLVWKTKFVTVALWVLVANGASACSDGDPESKAPAKQADAATETSGDTDADAGAEGGPSTSGGYDEGDLSGGKPWGE